MKAEIIAVGSELLTPDRVDTNSLFLTSELNKLGIEVTRKAVVGDNPAEIRDVFSQALSRADVVIATGGLGPTEDDLTREAVAELLGRKLESSPEVLRVIQERFRSIGRPMAENNLRQALVPEGAQVLENKRGSAPGLWLESEGRIVILLPGPPKEMEAMFARQVAERLGKRSSGKRLFARELRVTGLPESDVDLRVAPIYMKYMDVQTTILAAPGEIQIRLRTWSSDPRASEKLLDELVERLAITLGENLFSTQSESLEEVVANSLIKNKATISTAESCTGGLLAERLTRTPGSSAYFLGGVVSYSNELKSSWVDVPAEMIHAHGAVSAEVALALADGIRRRTGSTFGVGITGVAGPGGGTPEKPVGLVHIALADGGAPREHGIRFPGDRDRVRLQASQTALDMVRRYLLHASGKRGGAKG
ncbi:MAG TPA: competence/damage-inducible protein A [Candidatus Acidoferrales bacterium]|jgi:nicotinamide-nucleotide amidase|nr:competence/damage-inducible protein A [Candidatus Acidoferrales bacterium]